MKDWYPRGPGGNIPSASRNSRSLMNEANWMLRWIATYTVTNVNMAVVWATSTNLMFHRRTWCQRGSQQKQIFQHGKTSRECCIVGLGHLLRLVHSSNPYDLGEVERRRSLVGRTEGGDLPNVRSGTSGFPERNMHHLRRNRQGELWLTGVGIEQPKWDMICTTEGVRMCSPEFT